jgi:pantetheine-phosphate adenylyltransferase
MPRTAIYAGTFDPPTRGHVWMLEQAARLFDEVVVAIGINPDKRTMFPLAERQSMLRAVSAGLPNVRVATFEHQYLIHYARTVGADVIVRGIRNGDDYEYERAMRHINADLDPTVPTVFLMPPRDIAEVSSGVVKNLVGPRGWEATVARYVTTPVLQRLLELRHTPWQTLVSLGAADTDENRRAFWDELWAGYFHAGRYYHDWRHVCAIANGLGEIRAELADPAAVELAIWFHDLVYDPRASDNEERSAAAAERALDRLGVPRPFVDAVARLVMATKHDGRAPDGSDAAHLIDLDLAVLGGAPAEFDRYEAGIRAEYAHVSDADYAVGRAAVLTRFLDRPAIFTTATYGDRYEAAARRQLRTAIDRLSRGK